MYCMHCGIELPAEAKFCHQCGQALPKIDIAVADSKVQPENDWRICEIIYQTTGERWGIFPRDVGEFQARLVTPPGSADENRPTDNIIKTSAKIELLSCSFSPDQKNKRHRKAFDDMLQELLQDGWQQVAEKGAVWYNQTLRKLAE